MDKLLIKLLLLPRQIKQVIILSIDVILGFFVIWLSFSIRYETFHVPSDFQVFIYFFSILFIFFYSFFEIYKSYFRYTDFLYINRIILASFVFGIFYFFIITTFRFPHVPRSIGIIFPILICFFTIVSRISLVSIINIIQRDKITSRVLIYGAGEAGIKAASVYSVSKEHKFCAFIDDDTDRIGRKINNALIYPSSRISFVIKKYRINKILLAIGNSNYQKFRSVLSDLEKFNISVNKIPDFLDEVDAKKILRQNTHFEVNDLVNRKIIISSDIIDGVVGKSILITGAGGSIGSEIARQIIHHKPSNVILFDHSEYNLYEINREIKELASKASCKVDIFARLGSIKNIQTLENVFKDHSPAYVFHAAAYKHVPLIEDNPIEAITNNTLGTMNLLRVSEKNEVENFTLISTDKAVRPTNIMGASKRLAELCLQAIADSDSVIKKRAVYSIVRFGNVLGSSGSVLPLFYSQLETGGPITVTHEDVTRYFMTIEEAAGLVIQSTSIAKGNEVFILDMGKPIKILDLAKKVINLSGHKERSSHNPDGDIEIKITGLRPGEKLHEELVIDKDLDETTKSNILKAKENFLSLPEIEKIITKLVSVSKDNDTENLIKILKESGIEYLTNIN